MAVHKLKDKSKHCFENTTSKAIVVTEKENKFIVDVDGITVTAKKAISCLVHPKVGDTVLCFLDGAENYVLSVLESKVSNATHIKIKGSVTFETEQDVAFVSNNFNVVSRATTNMFNAEMNIHSKAACFKIDDITLNSERSVANIDNNHIVSKSIETMAETSIERYNNSFTFVECMSQLKAGNLMQTVKNLLTTRSRQAVMLADQDMKIDGERIHLG